MATHGLMPWASGRRPVATPMGDGNPFESLHREIDRLFDDFMRGFDVPLLRGSEEGKILPDVDVAETDKEVQVTADLPGVDEKDLEVTLAEGVLTISGEKKSEREEKKKDYHRIERVFGRFERSIALPEGLAEDKVAATFKNGVLTVTIPKKPEAKKSSRKIPIKTG